MTPYTPKPHCPQPEIYVLSLNLPFLPVPCRWNSEPYGPLWLLTFAWPRGPLRACVCTLLSAWPRCIPLYSKPRYSNAFLRPQSGSHLPAVTKESPSNICTVLRCGNTFPCHGSRASGSRGDVVCDTSEPTFMQGSSSRNLFVQVHTRRCVMARGFHPCTRTSQLLPQGMESLFPEPGGFVPCFSQGTKVTVTHRVLSKA